MRSERTGFAPLREGFVAELYGNTIHAEIIGAVMSHDLREEQPPHPDININDPGAGTALHWACAQRLREAALALLSCRFFVVLDARLDSDGSTALHISAAQGLEAVVAALLAHPEFAAVSGVDKDGFTALHGAAYQGYVGCCRLLLSDPRFGMAGGAAGTFDVARPPGHWAREACEEYDMHTALHMAASRGHVEVCRAILELSPPLGSGANATNRIGATALHMAARGYHTSTCQALLESKEFTAVNAHDARGFTALHWAAQQPSGHICDLILKRTDFTAIERKNLRGQTASDMAKEMGYHEVRRLILAREGARSAAESAPDLESGDVLRAIQRAV